MPIRSWGYLWGQAFVGLWRNGFMTLAAITTVAICLTVLAGVLLLAVNLQYMATFVEGQVEVVAYFEEELDPSWHGRVVENIESIPGVAGVGYVSRDDSMERLKEQFGDQAHLLAGLDNPENNPLRDSVEIRLASPEQARGVAERVANVNGVAEVSHRQDVVDRLLAITNMIRSGGLTLVGLLGIATVFVIANTIRLTVYARRHEIGIMKLVGATDGFIRWPFFLEGLIIGVAGAAIAAGVAWLGYDMMVSSLNTALPFLPILEQQPLVGNLAQLLVVLGAVLGAIGSSLSVRRFLRV